MRNLQAAPGNMQVRRNLVRLAIFASCLTSQVDASQPTAESGKPASVGITFKNGKVELPPPVDLPVTAPTIDLKNPSLPSIQFVIPGESAPTLAAPKQPALPALPALPSLPPPTNPETRQAPKAPEAVPSDLLPPPPLPESLTQTKKTDSVPGSLPGNSTRQGNSSAPATTKATPVRLTDASLEHIATSSSATSAPPQSGAMKFSLDDNGVIEHSNKSQSATATLQQRAPELVKPARSSAAKVVALPATKDPAVLAQNASNIATEADRSATIVMAPPSPSQPTTYATGPAIQNSRSGIPAPGGMINLPAGGRAAQAYPPSVTKMVSDESQDRVYEVEVLGTYNIVLPPNITSASARNADICNVFHNGPTLTIVGGMPGKTTIEVVMSNGQRRMIAFKVSASGADHAGPSKDLDRVMKMITQHFPSANIDFSQAPSGSVVLKGSAATEGDARKILELVRKVCLVPVEDKIQVMR